MPRSDDKSTKPTRKDAKEARKRQSKFRRAQVRNFLFTVGPARLTGGSISRRHLAQDFVVREVESSSPRWPQALDGLRIGHVSDFHLGELITIERALEAVELLREQQPEFIACTGDVVDLHHYGADELLRALAALEAPLGVALVLGNHDELHCPDTIMRLARDAGIIVLHDEAVVVRRNGVPFEIAGVSWAQDTIGCARRVNRVTGDTTSLLLAHNPKAFLAAAEREIPLTLSGHTHGGQVAMPRRRNTNLALSHRHSAGLFEIGPSRLFVTSGVGSWFPLRVNCPAEVAMITMRTETTETDGIGVQDTPDAPSPL